jgi:teichuronic acid biosynthesis glycosyltransferase TuaG
MDLISIIVTYYNKLEFIKDTLESISSQSYKNFEVLIIYDQKNSRDYDYIRSLIQSDPRFKLLDNKNNFGASYSKNIGINAAKGNYICFLDADDLWDIDKLNVQLTYMKKNEFLFSHTSYKIIDKYDNLIGRMVVKSSLGYEDLLNSCDIGLSTVMFHKSVKDQIKFPNISTKEDYAVWLKISKNINIIGIQQYLVSWRKLKKSLSSSVFQNFKDGFLVYYKYENKNFFNSLYLLLLLCFYSVIKKIKQKFLY